MPRAASRGPAHHPPQVFPGRTLPRASSWVSEEVEGQAEGDTEYFPALSILCAPFCGSCCPSLPLPGAVYESCCTDRAESTLPAGGQAAPAISGTPREQLLLPGEGSHGMGYRFSAAHPCYLYSTRMGGLHMEGTLLMLMTLNVESTALNPLTSDCVAESGKS